MFKLRYAAGNRAASTVGRTPLASATAAAGSSAAWQTACNASASTSGTASQQRRFNSGGKDYYKTLGVSKDASTQDIKKAYRKKAMVAHPDQGGNADEFAQISEAYEVLSNEEKKRIYDQYGSEAAQSGMGGMGGPGGMGGMGGRSPEDIFSEFFGGGMGGMGGMGRRQQKVEDIDVKVRLTLEEVYSGVTKQVRVSRPTVCSDCNGKGTKSGEDKPKCGVCKGQGRVVRTMGGGGGVFQQVMSACDKCGGTGSAAKAGDNCGKCHGDGYRTQSAEVSIPIPAGCPNNAVLQAPGEGGVIPGAIPGNLNLHIEMIEHRVFRRRGNDLLMDIDLSFAEAMTGFERSVKLPDGRTVSVHSPKGEILQTSSVLKLQGEGLPPTDGGPRGDIYVMVKVKMPKTLNDEQREALEKAFGKAPKDPHATSGNTLQARMVKEGKEEFEAKKASTWARQEGGQQHHGGGGGGRRGGGGQAGGPEVQCANQ